MSYAGPVSRHQRNHDVTPIDDTTHGETAIHAPTKLFRPLPRLSTRGERTAALATGIVLGMAIGAAAALLFAPQSGVDTRQSIARRGHRLKRRSTNAWDDLRFELGQLQRKTFKRRAASSL
jgi:hypothetical protein